MARNSFSNSLMALSGTFSTGLLGMGLWGSIVHGSPFLFVFTLAGLATLSLAVSEVVGRPPIFELGYRVTAVGAWLWLTVMVADVMNQGEPLLLPHPHLTALFGLASGAFLLVALQSAGWIDGPLLWEASADG